MLNIDKLNELLIFNFKIAEESTGTSLKELEVELKYKVLNCEISELSTDSGDYLSLIKTIKGEDPEDEDSAVNKIEVLNVYKIKRSTEDAHFTNTIFNRKLLFHGSRIGNTRPIYILLIN